MLGPLSPRSIPQRERARVVHPRLPDVSELIAPVLSSTHHLPLGAQRAREAMSAVVAVLRKLVRALVFVARGKLSHYKQLPSLRAILLVSHREARVTLVERSAAGWDERDFRAGEQVEVREPRLSLSVDDLYRGVTLEPA